MKKLVIIGAGGHGRVIADIARLNGYADIVFLDDADIPCVSGKVCDYINYKDSSSFIVAIGNNGIRERIQNQLLDDKCEIATLVHPNAVIGSDVEIGVGSVVMAGVVINAGAKIKNGVIINTCSSVDHDCVIEDYVHVSIGVRLAGTVCIKERTMIGASATVINNISICSDCIIGAGAVVVKDITKCGTYVGMPAGRLYE